MASFLGMRKKENEFTGKQSPQPSKTNELFIQKQPVGVTAVITPWNFPAAMITRKVGPALAAGCTVVIKPAAKRRLTAIKLVQLGVQAGIPKGVLMSLPGNHKEIGEIWLADTRVRKLTFTGSTEVGRQLMKGAADTIKKISLELGGHAPAIVMDDCDLDKAVRGAPSKIQKRGPNMRLCKPHLCSRINCQSVH